MTVPRLLAIAVIFVGAALSWFALGASITVRTGTGCQRPVSSRCFSAIACRWVCARLSLKGSTLPCLVLIFRARGA